MLITVPYTIAKIMNHGVPANYIRVYHIMQCYTTMENHVFKEHFIVRENNIYYGGGEVQKLVGPLKYHFNNMCTENVGTYMHTHACRNTHTHTCLRQKK